MSDNPQSPLRQESMTTREEPDFDDNDHEQETGTVSPLGRETPSTQPTQTTPSPMRKTVSFQEDEAPPVKPPRPMSPQQQAENTLIEAFPSLDTKVVKAVLQASGGRVEPAFNALLGMSDPSFKPEENAAPLQPPRPTQRAPQNQLEADELYARQLAEQYNRPNYASGGGPRPQNTYNQRDYPSGRGPNQQQRQPAYDQYGDERRRSDDARNFFDDDLPEIGRNIQQGFLDTQKKVNSWITNFKKRIDGDEAEEDEDLYSSSQSGSRQTTGMTGRQNFGSSQSEQLRGIRKISESQQYQPRRSTEASHRYDADPHELDADEFEQLELRDDESGPPPPMPPRTSSRKTANPDLFKSSPARPPQSGPVDEVDAAERSASMGGAEGEKAKKWQPLTSVAPAPEEDNDPFSLGDEEDDKGDDLRKEDSNRLKEAARNSISAQGGGTGAAAEQGTLGGGSVLQESGRSGSLGTKNAEAEEILGGKKD